MPGHKFLHEQDILPKNLQIGRLFFASYGMHAVNYFVSLGIFMRDAEVTKSLINNLPLAGQFAYMAVRLQMFGGKTRHVWQSRLHS